MDAAEHSPNLPDYPDVVFNGVQLNRAEAMTLHVALQSYGMQMEQPNALGDDEHGEALRKSYLANIRSINRLSQ